MFAKRLFSSILLWSGLLCVLFYLGTLWSAIVCCVISTIALGEYHAMLEKGGLPNLRRWGLFTGLIVSISVWGSAANGHAQFANTIEIVLLVSFFLILFTRQLFVTENTRAIQTIAHTFLGVVYVSCLFNFFPKIKFFFYVNDKDLGPGWLFIFYLVVVTKFCDIGAYITGRLIGRHKAVPRISPNKTWEGFAGGVVISVMASVIAFKYIEPRIASTGFRLVDSIVLGVLLSIAGMVGDLAESLLKRQTGVKDSGGLVPGIGGALDLIDSLLFSAPVLYGYLVLLQNGIRLP